MSERILVADRSHHYLTATLCSLTVDGELCEHFCLTYQQGIDIVGGLHGNAVHSRNVFAFLDVHALLREWRAQGLGIRCTLIDVSNAVIAITLAGYLCSQQAHVNAFWLGILAWGNVAVAHGKLTYHLSDDVVQIQTGLGIRYQDCIAVTDGFPVVAMHVLQVEAVAESTPCLVEDLCPLLLVVHIGIQVAQIYGIVQLHLA